MVKKIKSINNGRALPNSISLSERTPTKAFERMQNEAWSACDRLRNGMITEEQFVTSLLGLARSDPKTLREDVFPPAVMWSTNEAVQVLECLALNFFARDSNYRKIGYRDPTDEELKSTIRTDILSMLASNRDPSKWWDGG